MQFDWTTFALEVLNFLVLLWILKRFLYRPVLAVLDARQKSMSDQADEAKRVREEANAMKAQYEIRLKTWQQEREQARQALEQELAHEREAGLQTLKKQLADEREKATLREQASNASREASSLHEAAGTAYRQVSAMLERLASANMTVRIATMVEEDLHALPDEQLSVLRDAAASLQEGETPEVAVAHPLDEESRRRIVQALSDATGRLLKPSFIEKPELVAGLRIAIGSCLLQANLADELSFFREPRAHA